MLEHGASRSADRGLITQASQDSIPWPKRSSPALLLRPPVSWHIGGARTALFNWLYARRHGGRMLLRIEDTDRERSTPEAITAILEGLDLARARRRRRDGLPVSSARARHREVAEDLLVERPRLSLLRQPERNSTRCANRPAPRSARRATTGAGATAIRRRRRPAIAPVIRLRAPLEGDTVVDDRVQGHVTWANKDLDDMVLLRSDGTPTYMLAVVVDDHDMGVTQIIRGDDHLTNAARQTQIYDALGWRECQAWRIFR